MKNNKINYLKQFFLKKNYKNLRIFNILYKIKLYKINKILNKQ